MAAREAFLLKYLPEPEFMDWYDLLTDFRSSSYRILGDLVCDIDDENTSRNARDLSVRQIPRVHRYDDCLYKEGFL